MRITKSTVFETGECAVPDLPTPEWAITIVQEACAEYHLEVPKLRFIRKRANGFGTSGLYKRHNKKGFIRVSVGRDTFEKHILLHELSHHLNTEGGHGQSFYRIFRDLLIKYDCLTEEYVKQEYEYRKISVRFLRPGAAVCDGGS